jgi:hypothetical protein
VSSGERLGVTIASLVSTPLGHAILLMSDHL